MANYYEYSIQDVTEPECVGVGCGDAPDGSARICISMEGEPVNPDLDSSWHKVGWKAITPACARHLYEQLTMVRHLFEQDAEAEPLVRYLSDGYSGEVSVPRRRSMTAGRVVEVLSDKPRRRALVENLSESVDILLTLVGTERTITLAPRAIVAIPEDFSGAVVASVVTAPSSQPEPAPAPDVETDELGEFQS
jgi:hypothetical protein